MDLALRAIADPTRRAIFDHAQRHSPTGVTVEQAAAAARIHRSVAFDHLEMLADAGLLSRGERAGRRGRPARTYVHSGSALQLSYPARQHLLLATVLASAFLGRPGELRAARSAARKAGRELGSRARGASSAIRALSSLGGRYLLKGEELHARNCIFREACTGNPAVCTVHAAIIEGALDSAGVTAGVSPTGADGAGGCRYLVEVAR